MNRFFSDVDYKPMSLMSLLISFVSLAVISVLIFGDLKPTTYHTFVAIDTAICCLFLLQITIDFIRSSNRSRYLKLHWIDIVASIPSIEILRVARLFHIVRIMYAIYSRQGFLKEITQNRREATIASIFTLLVILLTSGSASMLFLEGDIANSNIKTAGDALWWCLVTVSTIGYGDHYPVTVGGRLIASAVIICGVGVFGMISGLVASIITPPVKVMTIHDLDSDGVYLKAINRLVEQQTALDNKIARLEQALAMQADSNSEQGPELDSDSQSQPQSKTKQHE